MDKQESKDIVNGQISLELIMTSEEVEALIRAYEKQYGMDSKEMLRRKCEGTMPDNDNVMDWSISLDVR